MSNQIPIVIADFETSLSSAISAGDTSFTLTSATDDDGNALAAGKYCFTINNGSSNKQYLLGQLNGTTVTSVVSVDRRGNETSGAANAARAGSPVIISDFATIQRVADILRGQEELDGDNPIAYDAEPTLANRAEVATVGYVLDQVSGGTVNFDNQIISSSDATAGETIAAGDWVFFQTSDQEWYKADADTVAEVDNVEIGVALGAGSDGASISGGIQKSGVYTTTGLTAGDTYYIGNTAGVITNSAGTTKRVVGVALSSTKLLMNPVSAVSVTSREKDAMAGGGDFGTPSSTNKFLTEDYIPFVGPLLTTGVSKKITVNTTTTEIAANSTTETNIFSTTIPGGLLSTNNTIRFKVYISDFTVNTASTPNPVFRLKYGSTTVATFTFGTASNANAMSGYLEGMLMANASTSAQKGFFQVFTLHQPSSAPAIGDTSVDYANAHASGTASEDSTGDLVLSMTIQWGTNSSANNFVPAGAVVELIS